MDLQSRQSEPPSAQRDATGPSPRPTSSAETEQPPSAQQDQNDAQAPSTENTDDEETEDTDPDPAEDITDFDWDDLHVRYHEAMKSSHLHESELSQEWQSLMNFFRIWAESGHEHETERTFQRLKTRSAYVQNSEAALNHKRNHYINVVKAFESALNLLKAQGYGR